MLLNVRAVPLSLSHLFRVSVIGIGFALKATLAHAAVDQLSQEDVTEIMAQAVTEASRIDPKAIIAITDREGFVLGVWDVGNRLPNPLPPAIPLTKDSIRIYGLIAGAITRAGTAAYLSSNQEAFTSRTAGYIIQQHFPVGVRNTGPGPLVGVGFSNLFYSDINRFKLIPPGFDNAPFGPTINSGTRGGTVLFGSLNDSPGGVPLYKNGHLVGGIGVTGDGNPTDLAPAAAIFLGEKRNDATIGYKSDRDTDEEVALAGQTGFRPPSDILATNVLINGIRIPYVGVRKEEIEDAHNVSSLGSIGRVVPGYEIHASPAPFPYEVATFGSVEGEIRAPIIDDPLLNSPTRGLIGKARRLNADEVTGIIDNAAKRAGITRAGIRLPVGTSAKVFIVVVSNPNRAGEAPAVLGTFRAGEATLFSWDVAAQKARSALFFSNRQLAQTTRTIGFLAQRFYPPGLDGHPHGPYFGFQEAITLRQARGGTAAAPKFPGNPNLPNGLTIFPGGFPLYRDGYLVGAIGISGDGVDQDDIIGLSGTVQFPPKGKISADNYTYRGARLPYTKWPRDPVR
ncbi:MAG: hypothetical protein JWL90_350 [Chthoniobacteraceae bacterium]|nr:hypothetical protein [Chthoniobacteraceae bacterium]